MRLGKRHDPHYRIIVIPARTKREGRAVEQIGHYNPKSKEVTVDVERAKYWLSVGAQPTATVHSILAKKKLLKPLERTKREPKKAKKAKEADTKTKAPEKKTEKETAEKKDEIKQKSEDTTEKKADKKEEKKEPKTAKETEAQTKKEQKKETEESK